MERKHAFGLSTEQSKEKSLRLFFSGLSGWILVGCCLATAVAGTLATTHSLEYTQGAFRAYAGPTGAVQQGGNLQDFGIGFAYSDPIAAQFVRFDLQVGPNTHYINWGASVILADTNTQDYLLEGVQWEEYGHLP